MQLFGATIPETGQVRQLKQVHFKVSAVFKQRLTITWKHHAPAAAHAGHLSCKSTVKKRRWISTGALLQLVLLLRCALVHLQFFVGRWRLVAQ